MTERKKRGQANLPSVKKNLADDKNFSRRTMIVRDAHLKAIENLAGYDADGVYHRKYRVLDEVIAEGIRAVQKKRKAR